MMAVKAYLSIKVKFLPEDFEVWQKKRKLSTKLPKNPMGGTKLLKSQGLMELIARASLVTTMVTGAAAGTAEADATVTADATEATEIGTEGAGVAEIETEITGAVAKIAADATEIIKGHCVFFTNQENLNRSLWCFRLRAET